MKLNATPDIRTHLRVFPGGSVVKKLPARAGDTGSVPGPGRPVQPKVNKSLKKKKKKTLVGVGNLSELENKPIHTNQIIT